MYNLKKAPKVSREKLVASLNRFSGSPKLTAAYFAVTRECIHNWMHYYRIKGKMIYA